MTSTACSRPPNAGSATSSTSSALSSITASPSRSRTQLRRRVQRRARQAVLERATRAEARRSHTPPRRVSARAGLRVSGVASAGAGAWPLSSQERDDDDGGRSGVAGDMAIREGPGGPVGAWPERRYAPTYADAQVSPLTGWSLVAVGALAASYGVVRAASALPRVR